MKRFGSLFLVSVGLLSAGVVTANGAWARTQSDALDTEALNKLVNGLGYETTNLAEKGQKPVYEFVYKTAKFNIPMSIELSGSGRYVWLTSNLGVDISKIDAAAILKLTADTQPTHFWANKSNKLKVGMAMDNRGVTPAVLKFSIEKIGADIEKSADVWNK